MTRRDIAAYARAEYVCAVLACAPEPLSIDDVRVRRRPRLTDREVRCALRILRGAGRVRFERRSIGREGTTTRYWAARSEEVLDAG